MVDNINLGNEMYANVVGFLYKKNKYNAHNIFEDFVQIIDWNLIYK